MSRAQAGAGGSRAAKYDYLIKLLLIGDSGNYFYWNQFRYIFELKNNQIL